MTTLRKTSDLKWENSGQVIYEHWHISLSNIFTTEN